MKSLYRVEWQHTDESDGARVCKWNGNFVAGSVEGALAKARAFAKRRKVDTDLVFTDCARGESVDG
jgi:hypothetical protein